ncbi:MAG: 5'(3')-deoxyribonucleotidase [Chitinophagaceae bacterium]
MERIILDMDNVMAEINPQYIVYFKQVYGEELTLDALVEHQKKGTFPDYSRLHRLLEIPRFFRTLPVMADAQEVVQKLNDKYEIFIVSAAMEYPQALNEKLDWLAEYFPFIQTRQIAFTGSKKFVYGDVMIDDKVSNLNHFNGRKILFTHPNNLKYTDPQYTRADNWKEVEKILL